MSFIVVHEDTCKIKIYGPTMDIPAGGGEGSYSYSSISTPCDCQAHIVPVEVEEYPDGQMRLAPILGGVTMTEVMEAIEHSQGGGSGDGT